MCILYLFRFDFQIILDVFNFTIAYAMDKNNTVQFKTQFDYIPRKGHNVTPHVRSRGYLPTNGTNQR